ncbi:MAG: formylmethanofuran dehydrogenase subunit C [Burkholderiales bacterium]
MSALTFTLKEIPRQRIDMSPLTPDKLAGKSRKEIEKIPLQSGRRKIPTTEIFRIKGDDAGSIIFADACSKLDHIGAAMTGGRIRIDGDAGAYLAFQISGGDIILNGDAGAFAASGMKKGLVEISGSAGDFLAAALPGDQRGMAGGTVIVRGNAGDRVGDHMRRGVVLIEGAVGDYCAARMTAGTIAVLGESGILPGFAMKRGTLLLRKMPQRIPTTFNDCGPHRFGFLPILTKSWEAYRGKWARLANASKPMQRFMGDLANNGKGEILIGV